MTAPAQWKEEEATALVGDSSSACAGAAAAMPGLGSGINTQELLIVNVNH
jgi:hypothetical protein